MDALIFPGKGKDWLDGIGQEVLKAGYDATGLDLEDDFLNLKFSEQVAQAKQFIESGWDRCPLLIGKSYGAYLVLHALADLPSYPGAVLLFSPVIGMTVMKSEKGFMLSRPPRANFLLPLAESGSYPAPASFEIHTGAEDPICDPELAVRFGGAVEGCQVVVVPDSGHRLPPEYQNGVWGKQILC